MSVRTSWSGTIGFGLVSVPVRTAKAVDELGVAFNQFVWADGSLHPVGRRMVDKVTGGEVAYADIVRGYTRPDGSVVEVTNDELTALAPQSSKATDIKSFVDVTDVDPIYFASHEYVLPAKGGEKAYGLLLEAMLRTGKAGLGTTVRRSKEHQVLIRPTDGCIVVTFLSTFEEVRPVDGLGIVTPAVVDAEVDMATALIGSMSAPFDATAYIDTQRNRVMELIESKASGQPAPVLESTAAPAATSMMDALQASIAAAAKASAPARKRPSAAKKVPAKKVPAKKAARKLTRVS